MLVPIRNDLHTIIICAQLVSAVSATRFTNLITNFLHQAARRTNYDVTYMSDCSPLGIYPLFCTNISILPQTKVFPLTGYLID